MPKVIPAYSTWPYTPAAAEPSAAAAEPSTAAAKPATVAAVAPAAAAAAAAAAAEPTAVATTVPSAESTAVSAVAAATLVGPDRIFFSLAQIPYAEFPNFSLLCSDYAQRPIMLTNLPTPSEYDKVPWLENFSSRFSSEKTSYQFYGVIWLLLTQES